MIESIKKQVLVFEKDIYNIESQNPNVDVNSIKSTIESKIKEITKKYFETNDVELRETLKSDLIRYYNLLYYYQAKVNGLDRAYMLDAELEQLPNVYIIDQAPERFKIDEELLSQINIAEGLTMEQALELLRWTVNNTRDNLTLDEMERTGISDGVYGNSNLDGYCGLSQFSTLYPLQQLGLEITINNIGEIGGGRHAYGTVVIPIKSEGKIIEKRFLLDCTYRQFFTIPFNVVSRYLGNAPFPGFFLAQDESQIEFSKELLKNGFIEASLENLENYLKPFFAYSVPIDNIHELDERFSEINIYEILKNRQTVFDYEEEEFDKWGYNLKFPASKNKEI